MWNMDETDFRIGCGKAQLVVNMDAKLCSKRKEKEEEQGRKKKEREEKRAEKQANSQLAQIEFLLGGVSSAE